MSELTEDNASRLAKALIERHGITYEEAMYWLASLRLGLICDASIAESVALQAALVTAINTGGRAFHGGVHVVIPTGLPSLIPWPGQPALDEICRQLGAHLNILPKDISQRLFFCQPDNPEPEDLFVSATGWRGGVSPAIKPIKISSQIDFATGGVLAGGIGVAKGFLRAAGIDDRHHLQPSGASLWNPQMTWVDPGSDGPALAYLPQKLWLLGLGHLGQAYLWNIGLLPYDEPNLTQFMLQDFDHVVPANLGTGLLCTPKVVGKLKTRICLDWLSERGLRARMVERKFNSNTRPSDDEPLVALCGFDSSSPRRILENPGFDLVVEAGLGGGLRDFDHILLHTFPDASKRPEQIWTEEPVAKVSSETVRAFHQNRRCGVVAETLAGKSISTSFIGAIAGAFVTAEVLRGLHGGERAEFLRFQARRDHKPTIVALLETYQRRFARSGYLLLAKSTLKHDCLQVIPREPGNQPQTASHDAVAMS